MAMMFDDDVIVMLYNFLYYSFIIFNVQFLTPRLYTMVDDTISWYIVTVRAHACMCMWPWLVRVGARMHVVGKGSIINSLQVALRIDRVCLVSPQSELERSIEETIIYFEPWTQDRW